MSGVIGDEISSYADEVAAEVDESISFWDEAFVVGEGDGLALIDAGGLVVEVDANAVAVR